MSIQSSSVKPRSFAGTFYRYVLPVILLVLIIGGVVWVQQHLRQPTKTTSAPPTPSAKPHLVFARQIAEWDLVKEKNFKEFEVDKSWHYDFLFHNDTDRAIAIGLIATSCGCASVEIATLSEEEWKYAHDAQKVLPGDSINYHKEPAWHVLSADPDKKPFVMKAKEPGVVRAKWTTARKLPNQELKLTPTIWAQFAEEGYPTRQGFEFRIFEGIVTHPVRVYPSRIHVGILQPSGTVKVEFYVWSPTRDKLDVKFTTGPTPDPLVTIETRQIKREDCERYLLDVNKGKEKDKLKTRVLTAYRVTVTVHEKKGNDQIEQGVFYRKLYTQLDGVQNDELPAMEIVGQVAGQGLGDVKIGGSDDQGRIRFKSFEAKIGDTKIVELSSDAKVTLEPFAQDPATLEVELTLNKKISNSERKYWRLKVTVPPNAWSGSFSDTHAVRLRIVEKGQPDRFIRIPLEGTRDKETTLSPTRKRGIAFSLARRAQKEIPCLRVGLGASRLRVMR